MLREALELIAESYGRASRELLKGNAVADFIRHEVPRTLREVITNNHYVVEGSPGQGNWADVPWIAVFDPTVTISAGMSRTMLK